MKNSPLFSRKLLKGAYKKHLKPSIDAIKTLLQNTDFKINIQYIDTDTKKRSDYLANIKLLNRENLPGVNFEISIDEQIRNGGVKHMNSYGLDNELFIFSDHLVMKARSGSIRNFECSFPSVPRKLTGYLVHLETRRKTYNDSYFRICIPTGDKSIVYPADILDTELHLVFDVKQWDMQPSLIGVRFPSIKGMCIVLNIRGRQYHFYAVEDIKSIFIDSIEKQSFDDFQKATENILLGFGFLTARYYSGEVFTLISKDKHFKKISDISYCVKPEQISGQHQLINPAQLFQYYRNISSESTKEKFKDFHTRFPVDVFNRLCSQLSENPVLIRAIEILVNSISTKDPLQQGILCSVALETITELIADENEKTVKPIPDKKLAKSLIKKLKEVVKSEFNIPDEGGLIINSKLSDLNKPTNKSKLLFPFKHFGLFLSDLDKEILNYRNDFLHGRSPTPHQNVWQLELIALKLHYLAGILILKYIGYSGHVMNLPFWNVFNDKEKMSHYFPINSDQLEKIVESVKNTGDLSDDEIETFTRAGELSNFMDDLIRIV
ncbi:MAG: hypothetical protein V4541_00655 [Bacteroidota bacterium]